MKTLAKEITSLGKFHVRREGKPGVTLKGQPRNIWEKVSDICRDSFKGISPADLHGHTDLLQGSQPLK